MKNKQKSFAGDGWAIWIDGDDISTVYLNDWLDPRGHSFVDIAVHIPAFRRPGLSISIFHSLSRRQSLRTPRCFCGTSRSCGPYSAPAASSTI